MGVFDASLRTIGDRNGLAATVTVLNGRLSIEAGEQEIGEWSLDEIRLEPTPTGYRMAAEGEQLLIDIADTDTSNFDLALQGKNANKKKVARKAKVKDAAEAVPAGTPETAAPVEASPDADSPVEAPVRRRRRTKVSDHDDPNGYTGFLSDLDRALEAAERRWGSLLPSWLFTRGAVGLILGVLVMMVAAPQILFYLMLLGGVLMVMAGAVLYTDSVMAARWLPGRMTAMHVMTAGIGLLLVGVLVAVTAQNRIFVLSLGLVVLGAGYLATRIAGRRTA